MTGRTAASEATAAAAGYLSGGEQRPMYPLRVAVAVGTCAFAVETAIMELMPEWGRGLSPTLRAVVDSLTLCAALTPVLLFAIFRPLRATIRRLERALDQLRLTAEIVEKTSEAIVIADADARILHVNRSFTTITGYGADEAIGQKTSLLKSGIHDREFYEDLWSSIQTRGEWHGEIWNRKKDGEIYVEHLSITRIVAQPSGKVHYVAIFTQAHHDRLTGLANRHLFLSRLAASLQLASLTDEPVAVLFVDLDGFKAVNDAFGHDQGDRLLQAIGRGLKSVTKARGLAARFGGDEFVLLLQGSRDQAMELAEATRRTVREVSRKCEQWRGVSASVGVVVVEAADHAEPATLIQCADQAMYDAKRHRDRVVLGAYRPQAASANERAADRGQRAEPTGRSVRSELPVD